MIASSNNKSFYNPIKFIHGYSDGDEIERGFDPLNPISNPLTQIKFIIIILLIVVVILLILIDIIKRRKTKMKFINKLGFKTIKEYNEAKTLGFDNSMEREKSIALGCLNKFSYIILINNNYSSVFELNKDLKIILSDIDLILDKINIEKIRQDIENTKSPIDISKLYDQFKSQYGETARMILTKSETSLQMLSRIEDIRSKEIGPAFETLTYEQINEIKFKLKQKSSLLNSRQSISKEFEDRIQWFGPYQKLLEVIQKTSAGIPVQLQRIAELSGASPDQTKKIIKLLLQVNSKIGQYLEFEQVYIREEGVETAIDDLLDSYSRFEQNKHGKLE